MRTNEHATPERPRSAEAAAAAGQNHGTRVQGEAGAFTSILFESLPRDERLAELAEPGFFGDLNLDQVVAELAGPRAEYRLEPYFYLPLPDVDAVAYRHEVFRDLERDEVRAPVERFAEAMRRMREQLAQAQKLRVRLQRRAWLLDAIDVYCGAVEALAAGLAGLDLGARALRSLARYLADYASSGRFLSLTAETGALEQALSEVEYALHLQESRVTVERPEGQPDYAAEVEKTFARFEQGSVRSHLVTLHDHVEMNHVEERIAELVARLYPDTFRTLAGYCERHGAYLDPAIARFDRELQFYLGYLELVRRLRGAGLAVSYPEVSLRSKETEVAETFDLALAIKLVKSGEPVVVNDLELHGAERIFVVSGPNNGGKTTFARTVGQLHHLARLGLPVPGSRARLFLPDRIFTHFEREEEIETLRGKFEDELVRVHEILRRATAESLIVMNESFSSTTLDDARLVGGAVLERILELGSLGVYVTFVDELASLGEATVSMVSQIVPENPAERTYRVLRRPANGLAYAWAIADRYGLTYERLLRTLPP